MAPGLPSSGAGALDRWVEALRRADARRSLTQAGLDGLRWACIVYVGAVLAMLVAGGPPDAKGRLLVAMAASAVGAAVGHRTYRGQVRAPSSLVAALDGALEAGQLLTTAWAWRLGLVSSPLGPALARRADRLVEDRAPPVERLVPPVVGQGRTLVALAAAALVTLPGYDVGLDRLLQRLQPPPLASSSQQPAGAALSPEQSALLQRLASLLEQQAASTGDSGAARAAAELRQATSPASTRAQVADPQRPGSWGSIGEMPASGAGSVQAPFEGVPTSALGLEPLWGRLSLLARLARLGLISSDAADRAAEVLAMLAAHGEGDESPVEGTGALSEPHADAMTPLSSEARTTPDPAPLSPTPDERAGPDDGGGPPRSSTRPAQTSPATAPDEVVASGGQGDATRPTPAPAGGLPSEGPSDGAAPPSSRISPEMAEGSGPPGSGAGALPEELTGGPLPVDGGRIVLPSSPQLGPGEAHALPGVSARPAPLQGSVEEPGPLDVGAGPSQSAPAPELESVPLEYREAVRRYFEIRAGGEMDG